MSERSEGAATATSEEHAEKARRDPILKESLWEVYFPRNVHQDKHAVPVASFPMIVYFWPSMIVLLVCGTLQAAGLSSPALGWWATIVLSFNLMVIVTDLDQKKFLITVLVLAVGGLAAYISTLKDIAVVSTVGGWIAALDLAYSTHVYFVLSAVFWFFFVIGMIQPRVDYWRFEANEFVHYVQPWGRDQSIPRQGSTVSREVPDVLELMLTFGGGTLVIRREGQVVARIDHVPFLGRRMIAIEKLLGVTRVQEVG